MPPRWPRPPAGFPRPGAAHSRDRSARERYPSTGDGAKYGLARQLASAVAPLLDHAGRYGIDFRPYAPRIYESESR
ncbi:hypothetical protein SCA03_43430 [Streptomyces cacaoi]|uniref:Uncharacterized protein n=1 Tax=Streptomyces cacaoi TaxID=1898 RepID=A0A4Y3R2Q0_STRCI|nr:hypothetical protein SCA03_43430 [Streptomyces cacaoi]